MSDPKKPGSPGTNVPWPVFNARFRQSFGFDCSSMSDLERYLMTHPGQADWHQLKDWEDHEDVELLQQLKTLQPILGEVHVVTDACYGVGFCPFSCEVEKLETLIKDYVACFGEAFFNGDVLIVSHAHKRIWAFHHEGACAVIDFRDREMSAVS